MHAFLSIKAIGQGAASREEHRCPTVHLVPSPQACLASVHTVSSIGCSLPLAQHITVVLRQALEPKVGLRTSALPCPLNAGQHINVLPSTACMLA